VAAAERQQDLGIGAQGKWKHLSFNVQSSHAVTQCGTRAWKPSASVKIYQAHESTASFYFSVKGRMFKKYLLSYYGTALMLI